MGAIVNGIALHGGIVKPYGSTFLIFTDYMRPRDPAVGADEPAVVWVFTHDSVAVGEDGPTHQPVEHYAALRAIPHLSVIRPADANETVRGVAGRARAPDGPVALLLSRQGIATLDRRRASRRPQELERGGYVLWDSGGEPGTRALSPS